MVSWSGLAVCSHSKLAICVMVSWLVCMCEFYMRSNWNACKKNCHSSLSFYDSMHWCWGSNVFILSLTQGEQLADKIYFQYRKWCVPPLDFEIENLFWLVPQRLDHIALAIGWEGMKEGAQYEKWKWQTSTVHDASEMVKALLIKGGEKKKLFTSINNTGVGECVSMRVRGWVGERASAICESTSSAGLLGMQP